jgi:dolichol-phosphate mannosyltransferase/undecaprenyl-phosphate 4-deoxy-4-formamido-L-arabinose transferase
VGIIGSYLMNILEEAKKMPHYVVRRAETGDDPAGQCNE